jgi:hypothetical protein
VSLSDFLLLPPAVRVIFVVMLWPAIWAAAAFVMALVTDILALRRPEWQRRLRTKLLAD